MFVLSLASLPGLAEPTLLQQARRVFQPLPDSMATADNPTPPERVALGRRLFFDPRLSLDGAISCASCHLPGLHGTDGMAKSSGTRHRQNARNAPTVLNAALQFRAHWDGGRDSVEDQATRALTGPASFGNPDRAEAIAKLKAAGYETDFRRVFPGTPDPVTPENWGKAIGSFERMLVTPSPFDEFLKGRVEALSPVERQGLRAFMDLGCAGCHGGVALGGRSYEKFGLYGDYWTATGQATRDEGRYGLTRVAEDLYRFKVPGLRNVAMTPPYFHDGSIPELGQAVRIMGKLQLNRELTPGQVGDIVAFLGSLTGALPPLFAAEP